MKDNLKIYKIEDTTNTSSANEAAIAYVSMPSPLKLIGNISRDDKHSFLSVVKDGLGYDTLIEFMKMAEFHMDEMAHILHINSRTIRRLSSDDTLNIDLSEKLLELLRLYKFGIEIFGDLTVFNVWIRRSVRGLGDVTPMSLLDTGVGVEIVMDELERLAYGVYN